MFLMFNFSDISRFQLQIQEIEDVGGHCIGLIVGPNGKGDVCTSGRGVHFSTTEVDRLALRFANYCQGMILVFYRINWFDR